MSIKSITPRNDAGKVYLNDRHIYWDFNDKNLLQLDIPSITIIGEYTTQHAVYRNEWFIVFMLNNNETFQISTYAKGMQEVLSQLSVILHVEIFGKLAIADNFSSNVLYPPELIGKELYELRVIESKIWFDKFRSRLGFGNPLELVLRKDVVQFTS